MRKPTISLLRVEYTVSEDWSIRKIYCIKHEWQKYVWKQWWNRKKKNHVLLLVLYIPTKIFLFLFVLLSFSMSIDFVLFSLMIFLFLHFLFILNSLNNSLLVSSFPFISSTRFICRYDSYVWFFIFVLFHLHFIHFSFIFIIIIIRSLTQSLTFSLQLRQPIGFHNLWPIAGTFHSNWIPIIPPTLSLIS